MSVYDYEKLMQQTRRLAYEYRQTTGQPLPLTAEIARFDAKHHLQLSDPETVEAGVDAIAVEDGVVKKFMIKGRAQVAKEKSTQRIGQINFDAGWDYLVLVILDEHYEAAAIYQASREIIEEAIKGQKSNKRGAMTVAKFKAIATLRWACVDEEADESDG